MNIDNKYKELELVRDKKEKQLKSKYDVYIEEGVKGGDYYYKEGDVLEDLFVLNYIETYMKKNYPNYKK